MHDFTLPANIKQIGSIGTGLRIYMEDYVCTFLQQYATSGGYEERIAYLVGRHMLIDGQDYLFVSGAIYGMYAEQMEGYTRFSQKSAEYAEAMLDEYFPGQDIVGWMQSQPSYGTYLNQFYGGYHLRQFQKPHQVLLVMDPLERASTFYMANPNAVTPADRMTELSGHFIYYEKNINMHEYMLTNKSVDYAPKTPTFVDLTPVSPDPEPDLADEPYAFSQYEDQDADYSPDHSPDLLYEEEPLTPEAMVRRHKGESTKRKMLAAHQKRATSLVGSVCAVLFVVTFVMGVALVRNQDRIDRLEAEIRQLVTAHRNLFAQMSSPELAPAFAEATAPTTLPTQPPVVTQPATVPAAALPPVTEVPQAVATAPPTTLAPLPTTPPTIPTEAPATTLPPTPTRPPITGARIPESYVIQPGDSILAISLYFFGDANMVGEIMALNGIENPDLIVAGRTIFLPQH